MWLAHFVGYTYSVLVGNALISLVSDRMWRCLGWKGPGDRQFRPDAWQPRVVGVVERALYTAALQTGQGDFIGFWLAVKAAGQWKRWGESVEGRSIYQNFLIGNGLSIAYAATGAQLIRWVSEKEWVAATLVPAAELLGTVVLWIWLGRILRAASQ